LVYVFVSHSQFVLKQNTKELEVSLLNNEEDEPHSPQEIEA